MVVMDLSSVTTASFHLGAKGRFVLPAAVRREAGIADGADLVARAAGQGRVVIETRESVRARVWDAAPAAGGADATTDIRALRHDDTNVSDANAAARASSTPNEKAGRALLAHLGIT
jgi:bifunctional DNA-binding transcriptional regulator/antitoxin component of YhaV-PrlF toxin-antitoxin module